MCRTNVGAPLAPLAVRLRRPMPGKRQPYDDYFGCKVEFGAAEDHFVLADVADRPLPTANQELAALTPSCRAAAAPRGGDQPP
jgi:hypothetical protein